MRMDPRKARVYWVRRPEGKRDLLIFDGGYWGGNVHIYEYKESRSSQKIEEEMKAYYEKDELPIEIMTDIVQLWVEKRFGNSMSWKLTT